METEEFNNYEIAEISGNTLNQISELEKSMSIAADKNIVLIAYQRKELKDTR